ncbi:MAG: acyltransferase [Candidatus Helarchaeota archaeon]
MTKKNTIIVYIFITIALLFLVMGVIDYLFPGLTGTTLIFFHNFLHYMGDFFRFVFYDNLPTFFLWNFILMTGFIVVYIIGYNMTKKHRVGGSITSVMVSICWLIQFELTILWTILALIANPAWEMTWKVIFLVMAIPVLFIFIFFLNILADVVSFWLEMVNERREYAKLKYHIEKKGNVKLIHINTDESRINTIWSAAVYLLIEEALRKEGDSGSISRFMNSAIKNIIFEVATHFNFWHSFKNRLFRFVGLKIGYDVLIAQYTRVDGLLPNLITFEDHTAVGVSCNLICHAFQDRGELRAFLYGPIKICKFARIGANVTITPGVTIGEGSVVAANSLVNSDIPPYTMVGGIPAKEIKKLDPESYRPRIEKDVRLRRKKSE